eukprot:CAMPEP_0206547384 /NCGR_PEP_ID=MMETSP0325_2-20121206/13263_1 /ASSEMBLY_ACC=CAM_ASM_000347 /TAXON_ID=2866 /ORGANISM="Crypthecodinium cohnii, Strain Seligo" /LENGTH=540 /DNA_ID=CAMNT_0054046677 /DNA_START=44 /DNA_END=1663 /DNA_ORIENTATION=+
MGRAEQVASGEPKLFSGRSRTPRGRRGDASHRRRRRRHTAATTTTKAGPVSGSATKEEDNVALIVSGCANPTISDIVRGNYHLHSTNHGKPVHKKYGKTNDGEDILIYFWDDRDGLEMSGWWFGPIVGGDQVWAYHAPGADQDLPPTSDWTIPHDGPIDPTFSITRTDRETKFCEEKGIEEEQKPANKRDDKQTSKDALRKDRKHGEPRHRNHIGRRRGDDKDRHHRHGRRRHRRRRRRQNGGKESTNSYSSDDYEESDEEEAKTRPSSPSAANPQSQAASKQGRNGRTKAASPPVTVTTPSAAAAPPPTDGDFAKVKAASAAATRKATPRTAATASLVAEKSSSASSAKSLQSLAAASATLSEVKETLKKEIASRALNVAKREEGKGGENPSKASPQTEDSDVMSEIDRLRKDFAQKLEDIQRQTETVEKRPVEAQGDSKAHRTTGMENDVERKRAQQAAIAILLGLQRLAEALPETHEKLSKAFESLSKSELPKLGPLRELVEAEIARVKKSTFQYVSQLRAQRYSFRDWSDAQEDQA